jgi:hypothetical protein
LDVPAISQKGRECKAFICDTAQEQPKLQGRE